jgi:hypothetical protein
MIERGIPNVEAIEASQEENGKIELMKRKESLEPEEYVRKMLEERRAYQ